MAALLTKNQFATLTEYANRQRSPFRHGPSRLVTPTLTDTHQGYLTTRLVRRKASFQKINAKVKTIRPLYAAGVFIKKTTPPPAPAALVQIKKIAPAPVAKKPQTKTIVPTPIGDIEPKKASILRAIQANGWNPDCPPPMKRGWYMDPRELFYRVARCQFCGGINSAGRDGERLIELFDLLARNFMGRICFRDQGHMANMAEDLIQEALTKCSLVVDRFNVWEAPEKEGDPVEVKINNAFAYFTTVSRNKMFETLVGPLAVAEVHLEDLKTDSQAIGDLV